MNQQLVIKLTDEQQPLGTLAENPPLLYESLCYMFPNTIFSPKASLAQIGPLNYGVFEWAYEPQDTAYTLSNVDLGVIQHEDGVWRPTFSTRPATEEEIAARTEIQSLRVRQERRRLLKFSDWTQLPDNPLEQSKRDEWKTYRQALRDLPSQSGFPWDVNFPTEPN
jgi:hypothetical protein